MRAAPLFCSLVMHGAALVAALGAGALVGARALPPPRVELQSQVGSAPGAAPRCPDPAVTVEDLAAEQPLPELEFDSDEPEASPEHLLPAVPPAPVADPVRSAPPLAIVRRPAVLPPAAAATMAVPLADVAAEPVADNEPPGYPESERQRGHQGIVVVAVQVAADGRVVGVELARGCRHPALNREALRAVRSWRFRPALCGGAAVASHTEVEIEFRLH